MDKVPDIVERSFSIFIWFSISLKGALDSAIDTELSSQITANDCPYPVATLSIRLAIKMSQAMEYGIVGKRTIVQLSYK